MRLGVMERGDEFTTSAGTFFWKAAEIQDLALTAAAASPRQVSQQALIFTFKLFSESPSKSRTGGCACSGQRTAAIFADSCSFTFWRAASSMVDSSLPLPTSLPPILNLICIPPPAPNSNSSTARRGSSFRYAVSGSGGPTLDLLFALQFSVRLKHRYARRPRLIHAHQSQRAAHQSHVLGEVDHLILSLSGILDIPEVMHHGRDA